MKNYSLALGWWAARWLCHLGVLKYLEEKHVAINEVAWTSMWAVVAALFAIWKNSSEIEHIAKDLSLIKLVDLDFKTGLLKGNKIERQLEEIFWNFLIEETKLPLKIIATNIETGKSKIFTSWKITEALRASISLPWIFTPKKIDSQDYADGWIMMNLPIQALSWNEIIAVSALKINTWPIEKTKTLMWMEFSSWFFKNNYEIIKRSVILMMKVNEDDSIKTPWKTVQLLRPNFWKLDVADFNKVDEFITIGYNETVKTLEL